MTKKLIVIIANTDCGNSEGFGTPIFQASVAAAMEYEVTVVCTATARQLMRKGFPEMLAIGQGASRTIYDFIKDAREAGVKFYCCSPNIEPFAMGTDDLIPECAGIIGSAQLIEHIMESDDVKVLSY